MSILLGVLWSIFYVPFLRYSPEVTKLDFPELAGHIAHIAAMTHILVVSTAIAPGAGVCERSVPVSATKLLVFPFPSVARAIPNVVLVGIGTGVKGKAFLCHDLLYAAIKAGALIRIFEGFTVLPALLHARLGVCCPCCQEQRSDTG
jgi:hypothetical protein